MRGAMLPKASLRIVLRLSESTNGIYLPLLYSPDQMITWKQEPLDNFVFFSPVVTTPNGVKKNVAFIKNLATIKSL